jgi:hypothetical protein
MRAWSSFGARGPRVRADMRIVLGKKATTVMSQRDFTAFRR